LKLPAEDGKMRLTDYWKGHEIRRESKFAILTDIVHREWTELKVQEHKALKGLKRQNLRDHMSEAELIFYRPGRTFYTADCRNDERHRHEREQGSR